MFSKLLENPILTIATTITALVTVLNNLVGSLGLPAFWSDVMASIIIGYTTAYWLIYIFKELKKRDRVVGITTNSSKKSFFKRLLGVSGIAAVVPALLALLVWNIVPPLQHIRNPHWTLCGTFTLSCSKKPCLILFDSRNRQIADDCYLLDDDSGYKYMTPSHWWTYQPVSVLIRCDGKNSERMNINESMFELTCDGRMDLR